MTFIVRLNILVFVFLALLGSVFSQAHARPTLTFSAPEKASVQSISFLVLQQAYDTLGYDIKTVEYPNVRSLLMADSGVVDGELSRISGLQNKFENLIEVPTPVNSLKLVVFGKSINGVSVTLEQLKETKLSCVRGVKIIESIVAREKLTCTYFNHVDQAIQVVDRDRLKWALLPQINGKSAIRELELKDIQEVSLPLDSKTLHHYLHLNNRELIAPLEQVLTEMTVSGQIDLIRDRFIKSFYHH